MFHTRSRDALVEKLSSMRKIILDCYLHALLFIKSNLISSVFKYIIIE